MEREQRSLRKGIDQISRHSLPTESWKQAELAEISPNESSSCCCLGAKPRLNQSQINTKIKHQYIHDTKYETNTNTFILIHKLQCMLFFRTICSIHTFILSTHIAYSLFLEKFSQVNPQTDKQKLYNQDKRFRKVNVSEQSSMQGKYLFSW